MLYAHHLHFYEWLVMWVMHSFYRYDWELVDLNVAKSEAAKLHEAIEKKQLDRDEVMWILSTRNFFQLRATFKHYKQNYQVPIYQV